MPHAYTPQYGRPSHLHLLAAKDAPAPRVLCQWPIMGFDDFGTVVRRAWPTDADGRYQPPPPEPRTYAPVDEPEWRRPLPWAEGKFDWLTWLAAGVFAAYLGYLGWRRRWRRLGFLVVLAGLAAVVYTAILLILQPPDEPYSWRGWYMILVPGMALVLARMIVWTAGKWSLRGVRRLVRRVGAGARA